jgi:8-amino-7-oxononanoate synthase
MADVYERMLGELADAGRLRALASRSGHDFSSNDYLGLAESRELADAARAALDRGVPAGSGGSRLLRGNHPEHEALEADAARLFKSETALYFGGGFAANFALFSAVPQRGDLVVYDELIHASVHEGMRAGRATCLMAPHNDAGAVEDAIGRWRAEGGKGRAWIAVESLYSMDGDRAPIDDLMAVADRHDAMLVIDEAHATGVLGPRGHGLAAHLEGRSNVITLHTCGKALGVVGALLCLPRSMRDFIVNRSRSFIYATAPPPLMAAVVRAALAISETADERRQRLASIVTIAGERLAAHGFAASGSQIQPIIVGEDTRAVELARRLQAKGFDIRAIRPPTVPPGTARLRMALTLNTDEATVTCLIDTLADELAAMKWNTP